MHDITDGGESSIVTETKQAFKRRSGLGFTKINELIRSREIDSFTVGKRRLIIVGSYSRYIKRQLEKQAAQ